ncbi:MAG TPA: hypothetical protein VG652_07780 [Gaiellaceae bacterium]|nr:hypothetical protein [Gaiellaceae bacterium]
MKSLAALGCAFALLAAATTAAQARPETTAPTIRYLDSVILSDTGVKLHSTRVRTATGSVLVVVFKIRNSSKTARRFEIGSYQSPFVPAGKSRNYSVGFSGAEKLPYRSVARTGKKFSGTFTVI